MHPFRETTVGSICQHNDKVWICSNDQKIKIAMITGTFPLLHINTAMITLPYGFNGYN